MHSAPAVTYPVGRSHFQAWLIGLVGLGGALAGLLWHRQADLAAWRQWLFGLTLLGTCMLACAAWLRFRPGNLCWDGQSWSWTTRDASVCGALVVHLDWQYGLLVSLRSDTGRRVWLWPQRSADVAFWNALRCAVFSCGAAGQAREFRVDPHGTQR